MFFWSLIFFCTFLIHFRYILVLFFIMRKNIMVDFGHIEKNLLVLPGKLMVN